MEQLELFEEPIERVILEQNKVDLSTLREDPYRKNGKGYPYSDIIPGKYFIYKTGGLHFNENFHKFGRNRCVAEFQLFVLSHIEEKHYPTVIGYLLLHLD